GYIGKNAPQKELPVETHSAPAGSPSNGPAEARPQASRDALTPDESSRRRADAGTAGVGGAQQRQALQPDQAFAPSPSRDQTGVAAPAVVPPSEPPAEFGALKDLDKKEAGRDERAAARTAGAPAAGALSQVAPATVAPDAKTKTEDLERSRPSAFASPCAE